VPSHHDQLAFSTRRGRPSKAIDELRKLPRYGASVIGPRPTRPPPSTTSRRSVTAPKKLVTTGICRSGMFTQSTRSASRLGTAAATRATAHAQTRRAALVVIALASRWGRFSVTVGFSRA